jgi:exodeoxyribonuclease III
MKIISYNILRGGQFEAGNRLGQIVKFLGEEDPLICGLFECDQFDANDMKIARLLESELGKKIALHRTRSKSHIGILYDDSLTLLRVLTFDRFLYHGLLAVDFQYQDLEFRVVLVHLNPYSSELRLIESQIVTQIALRAHHTLIMGDFNCPPPGSNLNIEDFKKSFQARTTNQMKELDTRGIQHIITSGFSDLWQDLNPQNKKGGTYPTPLGGKNEEYPYPVRIDYFFGSELFRKHCVRCDVIQTEILDYTSDHYPILSEFEL